MPRRNPPAKWVLPTVIDPPSRRCITIQVPNDPQHVAAFWGALLDLASAYKWADDPEHKAREVALVWKGIIDEMIWGCNLFDVRQNEEEPCRLEKTTNGTTWAEWADLQKCPPRIRLNNGILEWFDGSGWGALEDGDERQTGSDTPPWPDPPIGEDGRCLAAANITALYQTALTQVRGGLEAGLLPTAVAAGLTGLIAPFIPGTIYASIALSIVTAGFALGIAGLDDMLDTESLENFRCCLQTSVGTDGSWTALQFNAARDCMATWAASVELLIIQSWLDGLGPVGLTRAGAGAGITTADCDTCEWCYEWDFLTSDGGWYFRPRTGEPTTAWSSGVGWVATGTAPADFQGIAARISNNIDATNLKEFTIKYKVLSNTNGTAIRGYLVNTDEGQLQLCPNVSPTGSTITQTKTFTPETYLSTEMWADLIDPGSSGTVSGSIAIEYLQFKGDGFNPYGANNC